MADFEEFEEGDSLIGYTVEIVTAHVSHSNVAMSDIPGFIQQVHGALAGLRQPAEPEEVAAVPIIDPRKSVKPDYIICLECGKKSKLLRGHLQNIHGLTPEEYRAKYGLPESYPMVAKNYAEAARKRAIDRGLGQLGHRFQKGHGNVARHPAKPRAVTKA